MNKRIIVLVGPPGVGKSTLVKLAKQKGFNAIDIEDIHNEKKLELQKTFVDGYKEPLALEMDKIILDLVENAPNEISIFGAGGYGSHFPIEKIEKVLLLPPFDIYKKRWKDRDASDETKRLQAQKGEIIYKSFVDRIKSGEGNFHRIIDTVGTPEEILELIFK